METKVYVFVGVNSASIDIPTGPKGSVHIEFTGGNIYDSINYALARTKGITDPAVQAVIENCSLFGTKILLEKVEVVNEGAANKAPTEYPEVTSLHQAMEILKSEYGAKAGQIKGVAAVKSFAQSVNVTFPNWQV